MLDKAKQLAAEHLEVALDDVQYGQGHCFILGTDRSVALGELARFARTKGDVLIGAAIRHRICQILYAKEIPDF